MTTPVEEASEGLKGDPEDNSRGNGVQDPSSCQPPAGEDVRQSLVVLQKKNDELQERYLRLAAEFDNFRKRAERDREQYQKFATEQFAVALLEVADNLDRAVKSEGNAMQGGLYEGLIQIQKLFVKILEQQGILPMESIGKQFNPIKHEAVAVIPSDAVEGTIVDEICRGYCMNDRIIRCAKVAVSRGPNKTEE